MITIDYKAYISPKECVKLKKKGAIYAGHERDAPEKYRKKIIKQLREYVIISEV